jgi:predicted nucleic acid-binding protein
VAIELGINIVGTLGLVIKAKQNGVIDSAKNLIEKLENEGFRISNGLKLQVLKSLNEI